MGALPELDENQPMTRTVLIVDDHPSFRSSARRLLEADGYDVVGEAQDGTSAVEAAHRLRPDVVLLDVQLPDMDGFAVAERIQEQEGEKAPRIVLTSSRDPGDFDGLIDRSPAVGFICKSELSGDALAALLE